MNDFFFAKVSLNQYLADNKDRIDVHMPESIDVVRGEWEKIRLPRRATGASAGYDFVSPKNIYLKPGKPYLIQTGIRAKLPSDYVLLLVPRSGLGFKYGFRLLNTVGVVDSDYFNADNEGHIAAKVVVDEPLELKAGDRFMQGLFVKYGIVEDDEPKDAERKGGFGSTGA